MRLPPTAAIIAAAGQGRRFGGRVPKALVPLAGVPLFFHSVRLFASLPFIREIVIVLPRRWIARVRRDHPSLSLVAGGSRRQDSVLAGLEATASPIVLIHDAARPLVRGRAVAAVARAAASSGAAVLAAPAVDTLKLADARRRVLSTPDRSRVWHAQTPQGFRRGGLLAAYRANRRADATDDAQLVERAGGKVVIVPSNETNFKITTREDLVRAARILKP